MVLVGWWKLRYGRCFGVNVVGCCCRKSFSLWNIRLWVRDWSSDLVVCFDLIFFLMFVVVMHYCDSYVRFNEAVFWSLNILIVELLSRCFYCNWCFITLLKSPYEFFSSGEYYFAVGCFSLLFAFLRLIRCKSGWRYGRSSVRYVRSLSGWILCWGMLLLLP